MTKIQKNEERKLAQLAKRLLAMPPKEREPKRKKRKVLRRKPSRDEK